MLPPYSDVTPICAEAEPKRTLTVTDEPGLQKLGLDPRALMGELRTKVVWAPGARLKVSVTKVRGLPGAPPKDHVPLPPDVMLQGPVHAGGVVPPVSVPANTTWQVVEVQEMGLPPLFFIEMATAAGELASVGPALREAPTTAMLVLVVALPTRL